MVMGIYKITNKKTGKFYIGSSIDIAGRWAQHISLLKKGKHHSIHLQRAWDKYGEESFEFSVIEDVSDSLFVAAREQFWLWRECPHKNGYNRSPTAASVAGMKFVGRKMPERTEEHKVNHAKAMAGKRASEMTRKKISAALTGNKNSLGTKRTPEQIKKFVKAVKGTKRGEAAHRGRPLSEEHKAALRKPHRLTDEGRASILAAHKKRRGYKHSDETKEKMRQSALRRLAE